VTPEEAIKIVESKANGRTRYEGQEPFLDEVLVAEIKRLKNELNKSKAEHFIKLPYSRVLIPDETGGYFAKILEFPGCYSEGETPNEAIANLEEAAIGWLETVIDMGQEIPKVIELEKYDKDGNLILPKKCPMCGK
jgi:predicted RNase H-like HicB family nuclease